MNIHLKEPQRYRAVLIDAVTERDQFLESMLADRGIVVISRFANLSELDLQRTVPECDLVILYESEITASLIETIGAFKLKVSRPLLLITETDRPDAIFETASAGADHVLCIGVSVDRIRCAAESALAQFEKIESYRNKAEKACQDLENRKLIERAKGIIMEQRNVSESEAFREIQEKSMTRNTPMPEMARSIIEAKELLG